MSRILAAPHNLSSEFSVIAVRKACFAMRTHAISPSPEDYYYSGHAERLLHVWNPRRLATKPPRTQKSIYAASADHQNHGRVLNFRARAPRRRGTISAKPDWRETTHADLLKHQGLGGARRYLAKMKADYDHTVKHGPSDQHEVGASHYVSRGPIWKQFIAERKSQPGVASSLMAHASLRWINSVIDSGCSWHVHHRQEDVINIRPCRDTFRGVDNKLHRATCMGDLPAVVKNSNGKHVKILIRNVRVVPTLNDTLFSVDQFWEDSRVDTMFRDVRCVILPPTDKDPTRVMLPFVRRDKLFKWSILPIASVVATAARAPHDFKHLPTETARTLKTATIHAPSSHSHVASLPPNHGVARCEAPHSAYCQQWPRNPTCACAAGTSLPHTCKENYSRAKLSIAYHHRAKGTRLSAKMDYPWYAKS